MHEDEIRSRLGHTVLLYGYNKHWTSIIASFILWVMSFVVTGAKVVISDCIEKTKLQNKDGYR